MSKLAKFQVEDVSLISGQGYLVLARRLDDAVFWINESSLLDGAAIRHGDIPRALGEDGKQRMDLWGFFLANDEDSQRFYVGKLVELESEPATNQSRPREMLRKRLQKRMIIASILAVALLVGFTQLPFRMQGLVIETITLGDWPLEWAVHRQFERKQPELRSIIAFMKEQPEVDGLTVTPVGLRASVVGNEGEEYELDQPNILQALVSVEADFVRGHEDRVSVFLGTEFRGKTSFDVSYVYPLQPIEFPLCKSVETNSRAKVGYCGIELSEVWYASYIWRPTDFDELEKALEEMK